MDLETIRHSQVSQKEKKQVPYMNAYVWNLEKWYRWAYLQRINGEDIQNKIWITRVERGRQEEVGDWDWPIYTSHTMYQFSSVQSLSCVRLFATPWIAARQASLSITNSRSITNENLLYSTGSSTQCSVVT